MKYCKVVGSKSWKAFVMWHIKLYHVELQGMLFCPPFLLDCRTKD